MSGSRFVLKGIAVITAVLLLAVILPFAAEPGISIFGSEAFGTRVNDIRVLAAWDVTPASGFYNQGDTDVTMAYLNFTGLGNAPTSAEDVTGIDLNHTGTGAAADITEVTVYEDVDQDGLFEPDLDDGGPLGKSSTWTNGFMTVGFDYNLNIVRDSLENLWVIYNFSATAGGTHGLRIDGVDNISTPSPTVSDPTGSLPLQSVNLSLNPGILDYNVTGAATFLSAAPATNFYSGQNVEVTVKASHSYGEGDITGARITITDPGTNTVVNDQAMTETGSGAGSRDYSYTYSLPVPSPRGAYTVDITGDFTQGTDTDQTTFTVLNSQPQIVGGLGPFEKTEDAPDWQANLTGMKTDLEDSGVNLTWSVSNVNMSLVNITVVGDFLNFSLEPEAAGTNLVNLTVADTDAAEDTIQFWVNVTGLDDPPEITLIPDQNATEDADDWSLNLTGFKSDPEDAPDLLVWGVADVNTSIFDAVIVNDTLTFSLVENAFGIDDINVTLTDPGNNTAWQWVNVNITPVNDAPVWTDISNFIITGNGTNYTAALDLGDFASDVDSTDLAYALVSVSKPADIGVTVSSQGVVDVTIKNESFCGDVNVVVNVTDGEFTPQADFSIVCTGGENITMETELVEPANGAIFDNTTVDLGWYIVTWEGLGNDWLLMMENVTFDIYAGLIEANVTAKDPAYLLADGVSGLHHTLTGLTDNTTYFWTVIPVYGSIEGKCISGVWQFKVDTSFVIIHNLSLTADKLELELAPGENGTVNLEVTNLGNTVDRFIPSAPDVGSGIGHGLLFDNLTLAPDEKAAIVFTINTLADAAAGVYNITVTVTSSDPTVFRQVVIALTVTGDIVTDDDTDNDGLPDQWEIDNFGDLNEDAEGDYDDDGKTNLQEYNDDTDPTKKEAEGEEEEDDEDDDKGGSAVFWIVALIVGGLIIVIIVVLVIKQRKDEAEWEEGEEEEELFEDEDKDAEDEEEQEEEEEEDDLSDSEIEDLEADLDEMEKEMAGLDEDLPPAAAAVPDEEAPEEDAEPEDEKLPEWEDSQAEAEEEAVTGEPHEEDE